MINWFRKLIGLCIHAWHDDQQVDVYHGVHGNGIPISRYMRQRCERCKQYRKLQMS